MKHFPVLFLLLVTPLSAQASSAIWWPDWTISSSEDLSDKAKYRSYPVPLMLDGNPHTAWVYSATLPPAPPEDDDKALAVGKALVFEPSHPISVNGLRIMNGQNQSKARFLRNNRAIQIRVSLIYGAQVEKKTYALADRMGWHEVRWPSFRVQKIVIEFTKEKSGSANDLCIAELQFLTNGKARHWHLPRAVMFYDGTEGCTGLSLISHSGKVLQEVSLALGYTDEWNPAGQLVSGVTGERYLWVVDAKQGKTIRTIELADRKHNGFTDYRWLDNHNLQVEFEKNGKKQKQILKF